EMGILWRKHAGVAPYALLTTSAGPRPGPPASGTRHWSTRPPAGPPGPPGRAAAALEAARGAPRRPRWPIKFARPCRRDRRRAAHLCARCRRVRGRVAAVRDRTVNRSPDRLPGASGYFRRLVDAEFAGVDRGYFPGEGARPRDRHLDGLRDDRGGPRPVAGRHASGPGLVALDLCHQRADRDRVPVADLQGCPVEEPCCT